MNLRVSLFILGMLICCLALAMFIPLVTSWVYADGSSMGIFLAILTTTIIGLTLIFCCYRAMPFYNKKAPSLNHRNALATVGFCWIGASLVGALPFLFCADFSISDAIFESTSGFTTTGSSILSNIEALPQSLLIWRSLTHWLGGMGIIVLSLAILPFLGVGGMQLYKVEVTGPNPDKLTPKLRDTAMLLWQVYLIFTVALTLILWLGDMNFFDALNHAFATVSTGGFSTKNASLGAFSAYSQWVIIFFMFICGINFTLHYQFLIGQFTVYKKDSELLSYVSLLTICSIIITICLVLQTYNNNANFNFEYNIRTAIFNAVSICTTTGFTTVDYEKWFFVAQACLVFLMFLGGCAGSTSGGLKVMRIDLIAKFIGNDLYRIIHPHAVRHIRFNERPVSISVINGVVGFFLIFMLLLGVVTLIITAFNVDMNTAFSATLSSLSNVGPGLGSVGPVSNYGHLPEAVKIILCLCMLLGRLEIYAILVLLLPEYWKK